MKLSIKISILILLTAVANGSQKLTSFDKSVDAVIKSIKKCEIKTFRNEFGKHIDQLTDEFRNMNQAKQESFIYQESEEGILISFFSIQALKNKRVALPLISCRLIHWRLEKAKPGKERNAELENWYSCTQSIYKKEIELLKAYRDCRSQAI